MQEHFVKLFNTIVSSSIWNEDDKTRILWITMLAMADFDGTVLAALPGLARFANLSLTDTEKALGVLMTPDKHSRNENNDGIRIKKVPGGWFVLNYELYRDKRSSRAAYFRDWRAKKKEKEENATRLRNDSQHI